MKKLLILIIPISLLSFTIIDWVQVSLDQRVSVSFPSQPEMTEMQGNKLWKLQVDSSYMCMAMVVNFQDYGLDSAGVVLALKEDDFYTNFKSSMLAQMTNAEVVSEEITKVKDLPAYNLVVSKKADGAELDRMYIHNIFLADKMYTLYFYESSKRPQLINRNKFLESFTRK